MDHGALIMIVTLADGTHATTDAVPLSRPVYFPENYLPRCGPRRHLFNVPDGEERPVSAVVDVEAREVRVWVWLRPEDVQPRPMFGDDYFADIEGWQPLDDRTP
jgi:hypothetical protein